MAAYFLLGTGIPVCIYCIIFIADPYEHYKQYVGLSIIAVFAVVFMPLAMLMYLPFYMLGQIFVYLRKAIKTEKLMALLGCAMPFATFAIYLVPFGKNYRIYMHAWHQFGNTEQFAAALPRNYFTERFLGIGFKYHTKLNVIYDGWRPPLHDPYLNAALWIYSKGENGYYPPPFYLDYIIPPNNALGLPAEVYGIEPKLRYYHELFPGQSLQVSCPCNYSHDGESYFSENFDSLARHH